MNEGPHEDFTKCKFCGAEYSHEDEEHFWACGTTWGSETDEHYNTQFGYCQSDDCKDSELQQLRVWKKCMQDTRQICEKSCENKHAKDCALGKMLRR